VFSVVLAVVANKRILETCSKTLNPRSAAHQNFERPQLHKCQKHCLEKGSLISPYSQRTIFFGTHLTNEQQNTPTYQYLHTSNPRHSHPPFSSTTLTMCNGHSTRVSQGGSIAVLKPTPHFKRTHTNDDMLLFFSNRLRSQGTSIELQGWGDEARRKSHWVVIQYASLPLPLPHSNPHCHFLTYDSNALSSRDGDLSIPSTPEREVKESLYSFALEGKEDKEMQLPQSLDLGVSDVGIIGRRVSVMTASNNGALTVAEGIIGWN
jgi:hypothetical protein